MAWDFSTDPEWAEQLAWVDDFVRSECEPIDLIVKESHDLNDPVRQALIPPLQQIVKDRGLWATHLGPHLGGPGYGQVKLALLNEILGRSECAPDRFRFAGTRFRQQRDPGPLRDARTEAALPRAAARQPHRVMLLDDRTPGRRRPEGVHHHGGTRRGPLGDQRREVVLVLCVDGVVHHRDGDDRSGCAALRTVFDVRCSRRAHQASMSCAMSASAINRSAAAAVRAMCDTKTFACQTITCSAHGAARSSWHRPGWAAGASTTPCAPSVWSGASST